MATVAEAEVTAAPQRGQQTATVAEAVAPPRALFPPCFPPLPLLPGWGPPEVHRQAASMHARGP